ncbi:uncharacterized protein F5147DRAFT_655547 [Suillus discolor]|uniref:Uncharacterized protein n=1 Tax=Suillus discolor TaxID=1912936 RepID=A0A9P7F158_9AGAM|nr:uncharacterized protein F5147DRAFT_655547 [Suillus discolor]KAG2100426.1 hypothetical protein F5147DRAFT_655547 [Suillus discolor]
MSHTIELLEEIFALGLADHVRKKAFTRGWAKLVVPAACHTQDSADNRNIFQLGSHASLPFPPPPSVAVSHSAATSTLEDVLQRPDFETWLLAHQQDQQSTSNMMLGVWPPTRQTRHTQVSPALTQQPNNGEMWRMRIQPTPTSTSSSTVSSISRSARSQRPSDDSDSIDDSEANCSASCCSYSECALQGANRTFNRSPAVAEQRQFPGVDRTMEFSISAVSHEHDEDLTWFCPSASIGASDGRPPPPPYEFATNGPVVFMQNGIVVRLGQGQANNARQR